MDYKDFGLVNTRKMFADALQNHYAVPAFNFYNAETLSAILDAAQVTHSPIILAASTSAIKYLTPELLRGLIWGADLKPDQQIALHLDHGKTLDACIDAIKMGFSSVMIDASQYSLDANIELTKTVVDYAHQFDVTVEAELGTLSGIEDENTHGKYGNYTNPSDVIRFVNETGIDSLAIAIGTSHGAYKRKSDNEELRFDILSDIAKQLPDFPLVLHGASSVPQNLIKEINEFGGQISGARGIPTSQIRRAVEMNICKVNVDSDLRLAFTAAVRQDLSAHPENFNPRQYLSAAIAEMRDTCINEIENTMGSANRI